MTVKKGEQSARILAIQRRKAIRAIQVKIDDLQGKKALIDSTLGELKTKLKQSKVK
jgi:hypothetical protein